jgi:hypothetical protein
MDDSLIHELKLLLKIGEEWDCQVELIEAFIDYLFSERSDYPSDEEFKEAAAYAIEEMEFLDTEDTEEIDE